MLLCFSSALASALNNDVTYFQDLPVLVSSTHFLRRGQRCCKQKQTDEVFKKQADWLIGRLWESCREKIVKFAVKRLVLFVRLFLNVIFSRRLHYFRRQSLGGQRTSEEDHEEKQSTESDRTGGIRAANQPGDCFRSSLSHFVTPKIGFGEQSQLVCLRLQAWNFFLSRVQFHLIFQT